MAQHISIGYRGEVALGKRGGEAPSRRSPRTGDHGPATGRAAPQALRAPAPRVLVRLWWGQALVSSRVVAAGRDVHVGEGDLALPDGLLPRTLLVRASAPGASEVLLPSGEVVPLALGTSVDLCFGAIRVSVAGAEDEERVPRRGLFAALGLTGLGCLCASLAVHASLLGSAAAFMPPLDPGRDDALTDEQRLIVLHYLDAVAEREREAERLAATEPLRAPGREEGRAGQAAAGEQGALGSPTHRAEDGRLAVVGPRDNPHPRIGRHELVADAQTFGIIGMLAASNNDPSAPQVPWRIDTLGSDPLSANGKLWADGIGDAAGAGGLSLTGIGEGGGRRGEGIGLFDGDGIGTMLHGTGRCSGLCGDGDGAGGIGRVAGSHRAGAPIVRVSRPAASGGRLPPEVIQRIVRQQHGRFRACYQQGLVSNPALQGRVAVSFIIGRDGRASQVSAGGDLPDAAVRACVAGAFAGLTFPQPEGGVVAVTYPLSLTPG
jgi:hypothetical protein